MSTIWVFNNVEHKYALYCVEDCLKKFCNSLREHATNVINFEKKKNATVNKKRAKIIPRCDGMLNMWKKFLKKVC